MLGQLGHGDKIRVALQLAVLENGDESLAPLRVRKDAEPRDLLVLQRHGVRAANAHDRDILHKCQSLRRGQRDADAGE